MNPVVSRTEIIDMITLWLAGANMTAPKMILFTNNAVINPNTVLADLTQPTASWYTPAAVVLLGPYETSPGGKLAAGLPSHVFPYTGVDPTCTIMGFGLTDTAGANLLCACLLPSPVIMSNVLDRCIVPATPITFPQISG
jgi:hypothetical protein